LYKSCFQDPKPAGYVQLDTNASITLLPAAKALGRDIRAPNAFCFQVVSNRSNLYMCGSSQEDADRWVNAITSAIQNKDTGIGSQLQFFKKISNKLL
tara:strand:- start:195 stop:485 length:291 start_codon:yes stop_codon:yes gene_type:complete